MLLYSQLLAVLWLLVLMKNVYRFVLFHCKVVMADSDVVVTTENVEILHIDFTASSTRPIHWRSKSILVVQLLHVMNYNDH